MAFALISIINGPICATTGGAHTHTHTVLAHPRRANAIDFFAARTVHGVRVLLAAVAAAMARPRAGQQWFLACEVFGTMRPVSNAMCAHVERDEITLNATVHGWCKVWVGGWVCVQCVWASFWAK